MKAALRRLGFLLSFAAALTLASHINHPDSKHSATDPSHHCCICHHTSYVPAAPAQTALEPVIVRTFYKPQVQEVRVAGIFLSTHLSRAPPAV